MEKVENNNQQSIPYTEFFSWGSDQYGQLALANSEDDQNQYYQQQPKCYDSPKSLSFDIIISSIACGDYHAIFISGEGFVFSVGLNTEGQLGVGDTQLDHSNAPLLIDTLPKGQNNPVQISCGGSQSAVVFQNGDLFLWGSGKFGANSQKQNTYTPVKVQSQERVDRFSYVSCGKRHTLCLDQYGSVYGCGDNRSSQLGINASEIEIVQQLVKIQDFQQKAKQVAAGLEHSLILTEDDKVYACGNNADGNLGLGHNYSSDRFLLVQGMQGFRIMTIEAGRHSAAITQDGRLFVWGPVFRGDKALLLPQELRSNKLMTSISIGEVISSVIDEDNHLYTWGNSGDKGELGRKDFSDESGMKMPQIVESLAHKIVKNVKVGLDFGIALGLDFDTLGNPIEEKRPPFIQQAAIIDKSPQSMKYQQHSPYSNTQAKYSNLSSQTQLPFQSYKDQVVVQNQPQIIGYDKSPMYQSSSYTNLNTSMKKEQVNQNNISAITAHSNKSRDLQTSSFVNQVINQQNQRLGNKQDSLSSFQSQQIQQTKIDKPSTPNQQPQTYVSPISNDLYKQIEQLREENFSLKQKNRDLNVQKNQMKEENDLLLKNAEEEVKRMSKFIDTYTLEIDQSKKQMEEDYEQKIQQEKNKLEDLKQKFHQDQNSLEIKLDSLQQEIETLRQENLQMKQQRYEIQNKEKHYLPLNQKDELRNRNLNVSPLPQRNQQEASLQYSTVDNGYRPKSPLKMSPISQNIDQFSRQNPNIRVNSYKDQQEKENQFQKAAFMYDTNFPKSHSDRDEMFSGQIVNQKSQNQLPNYKTNQESKEQFYVAQPYQQNQMPNYNQHNQKPSIYQDQYINQDQQERNFINVDSSRDHKQSLRSPMKQDAMQFQKPEFSRGNHQNDQEPALQNYDFNIQRSFKDNIGSREQFSYKGFNQNQDQNENVLTNSQNLIRERTPTISPLRSAHDKQNRHQQMFSINQDMLKSPPPTNHYIENFAGLKKDEKENAFSHQKFSQRHDQMENAINYSQGQSSLSDVKSRLVAMQKNKEELEEKLKSYEAKIKQHFNR